jgi:tetrahydromethanopterin S-methyltransferase subunit D
MTIAGIVLLVLFGGLGFVSRPLLALGIALAGVGVLLIGTSRRPDELISSAGVSPIVAAAVFFMVAVLMAYLMGYLCRWWRARV